MRNRAKCRLCNEIIESFHKHDYVQCKCEEIAIDGGQDHFRVNARDFSNFIRVDDMGSEIEVKVVDKDSKEEVITPISKEISPPTKEDLLNMLDEMVSSIESLPESAMRLPINHYDHLSFMMLIRQILRDP